MSRTAVRLLVVEECFAAPGGRVMVRPRVTLAKATREAFEVELRLPNGGARLVTAALDFAHIQGPLPPFAMVRLLGIAPEDVPPGTEIWSDSGPA